MERSKAACTWKPALHRLVVIREWEKVVYVRERAFWVLRGSSLIAPSGNGEIHVVTEFCLILCQITAIHPEANMYMCVC